MNGKLEWKYKNAINYIFCFIIGLFTYITGELLFSVAQIESTGKM